MNERRQPSQASIRELAFELRLAIGRDVGFNADFEAFIARLPDEVDRGSLNLTLEYCRGATERLAELYRLLRALAPFEQEVRAIAGRAEADSGDAAA